jgi:hypothetical protein
MPVRRTRACEGCRVAKARCSLATPCSRCAKRGLECLYPSRCTPHRRNEGLRSLKPAKNHSGSTEAAHGIAPEADAWESLPDVVASSLESGLELAQELSTTTRIQNISMDQPKNFETQELGISAYQYVRWPDDAFRLSPSVEPFGSPLPSFDSPINWLNAISSTQALGPQLSQRSRTLQQGSLTAKMVFARLTDFTRMLAEGKALPPFIYPPCSISNTGECPPGSRHRCLPGMMAVCANLTQMFYSRLPGSHSFVWQQICAHLRQIQSEVSDGPVSSKLLVY